jgi:hypothetical protein
MNVVSVLLEKLQRPQTHRRVLFVAEVLIVLAAFLAIVAVQDLNPLTLTLFLLVGLGCIVGGVFAYLLAVVADVLKHRGVSHVHFTPGEIIFRQGDPGDFVYNIVDGQVEVLRKEPAGEERVLNRLGPGEYLGEMALISNAPRTATARAITPVEAVALARADFTALYTYLPDVRRNVEKLIQQRRAADAVRK